MRVLDITDELKFYHKDSLKEKFEENKRSRSILYKGVSCIDLLELKEFQSRYKISVGRYLLIYNFHDLDENIRFFDAILLNECQTMQSYSSLWVG